MVGKIGVLLPARLEHLDVITEMVREYHAYDHLEFDEALTRRVLAQLMGDPSLGRLWVVESDSRIAGYLLMTFGFSIEFKGRDAFIDEFFLKKEFRGQGIGGSVLSAARQEAIGLGIKAIHLEVERKNKNALTLYEKLGFVDHDRFLMTYWTG